MASVLDNSPPNRQGVVGKFGFWILQKQGPGTSKPIAVRFWLPTSTCQSTLQQIALFTVSELIHLTNTYRPPAASKRGVQFPQTGPPYRPSPMSYGPSPILPAAGHQPPATGPTHRRQFVARMACLKLKMSNSELMEFYGQFVVAV